MRLPACARASAVKRAAVVFPTPPLREEKAITFMLCVPFSAGQDPLLNDWYADGVPPFVQESLSNIKGGRVEHVLTDCNTCVTLSLW